MEIALSPSFPGVTAPDLVALCVEAEHHGYRDAWLAEVAGPEAFALAGAIATATREMHVGVAVVAAANRSPALHAMAAATVSQLLNGRRFALGIGSSSELIVEGWHGREFDRPLVRVREAVEGAKTALAGGREYAGTTMKMSRFAIATPPAGPVPVYVGALGPAMLRLAGAVGDGVCLNLMPPAAVSRQLDAIHAGAAAAGRALPEGFGVMARFHVVVTEDRATGRDLIRAGFAPYFAQGVYNRFMAWCGWPEEAAAIAAGFAAGDRGAVARAFHDGIVDELALVGPPGHVRDRLAAFSEAGVGIGALNLMGGEAGKLAVDLAALAPR
jgi:probable F420-dependent oxidoreductase